MENHSEKLAVAKYIAKKAHKGQVDYSGKPYINHCMRASKNVRKYAIKTRIKDFEYSVQFCEIVAILHDSIKDSVDKESIAEKIRYSLGQGYLDIINILSHNKKDSYKEYILNINRNSYAKVCKLADLEDNLDNDRLFSIKNKTVLLRLLKKRQKYITSYALLLGAISEKEYLDME